MHDPNKKLPVGRPVDKQLLKARYERAAKAGWGKAKWIELCETLMADGYKLSLYEARKTHSKYINVKNGKKRFKIRVSNHKPIKHREVRQDCDFFVGITNIGPAATIYDAIKACREKLGEGLLR